MNVALRDLRWSQTELARRVRVHPSSVTRWINEDNVPGPVVAYLDLARQMRKLTDSLEPA